MRWTDRRLILALVVAVAALSLPWLRSAEDKLLSVNVNNGLYLVPVLDKDGQEYVDARELLQPLGEVELRIRGDKARLRSHGRELDFSHGTPGYEIQGKRASLAAPAIVEGEHLLLPYSSLPAVLAGVLKTRVDMNHNARRIFLGGAGVGFTAEVAHSGETSALHLRFSSPVNPTISAEGSRLRLSFQRDPVTSGNEAFKFDDRLITGANFLESGGLASLEVNGTAPLIAEFSDGGRTITISAAPGAQVAAAPPADTPPAPTPDSTLAPLPMPVPDVPPAATGTPHARYLVVIDASHGGAERGAALSQELAEKDVTLAFARRLRNELRERGVATLMMREADLTIPLEHRAETVNVAHAAVYISIHASTPGPGVRLYTSMLRPAEPRSGLVPWEEAQASHVSASRKLISQVSAALEKNRFDVGFMPAPVRPLNSVAAAAIAVELSPPRGDTESILNSGFQASLASALASAVLNARGDVEAAR